MPSVLPWFNQEAGPGPLYPLYRAAEFLYIRDSMPEVIPIGADHAGFELKQNLAAYLREHGHEVIDKGTDRIEAVDYPDFAEAVGAVHQLGDARL